MVTVQTYGAYELHGLNLSTPETSFSTVLPSTPRSALLDSAVPDRPVVIHNTAGHATRVITTMVGGKIVYSAPP
jgi:predicted amidohydrolase YtcJ